MLVDVVDTAMTQRCGLSGRPRILIGVSGGADSLCLLDVLHRLGFPIVVGHFDHGLRPESVDESKKVADQARERGVEFVTERLLVADYARDHNLSLETAARTLRYRFLFRAAERHQAEGVVVAHTADDQVETVLMHLLRGSGLQGLLGMPYRAIRPVWHTQLPLLRPILGVWRIETWEYCREHGLEPSLDPSNQDPAFTRNRIRTELIPYLEDYNPQVRQALWRMAETLAGDLAILEVQVAEAWNKVLLEKMGAGLRLRRTGFSGLSLGLQRRVIRKAFGELKPGSQGMDFAAVERALTLLESRNRTASSDLGSGLRLLVEGDDVWMVKGEADVPGDDLPQFRYSEMVSLPVPGEVDLAGGWVLEARPGPQPLEAMRCIRQNTDSNQVWVDADRISSPLAVRVRQPGDRFQPLGMSTGHQKVSDFMVNLKIPRRARAAWPLVVSGLKIVWIPGYRLAHPFRLTAETRSVISLRLRSLI